MPNLYFPTVFDFGVDVPWPIRFDVWATFLKRNPNEWFLVHREDHRRRVFYMSTELRKRGCLTAVHRYSDGSHAVYAALWRFDDEGT